MAYHRNPVQTKIEPKHNNYHSDGTGRDFYIKHFNGGQISSTLFDKIAPKATNIYEKMHFLTPSAKQNKQLNVPPKLPMKTSKYWGDGSGRDFFVIQNDGGQSIPYRWYDHYDIAFKSSLRSYQTMTQPTPSKDPQFKRTMSALFSKQQGHADKLAKPKKVFQPNHRPHTPNISKAHEIYQSYQTLKYQSKARN